MRRRGLLIAKAVGGVAIVAGSFVGALWLMDLMWPPAGTGQRPALAATPPLPPLSRPSTVIAPVAIALAAIRDTLDQAAPRNLTGTRDNPLGDLLGKADIGWTLTRTPLAIAGRGDGMVLTTALNGTLRVTGQISNQAGNVTGRLSSLLDSNLGREMGQLTGRALDQRADVRGTVAVASRPALTAGWRLEPNLGVQVAVGDSALSIAGLKLSVSKEVKPLLDRAVSEQVAALQARLRTDPFIETAARREWAKLCRSIPLRGAGLGTGWGAAAPELWLDMRPVRAFAAQPRTDAAALTVTLGVQAETRVVAAATQPDCPFPKELELVAPMEGGRLAIVVPIDLPFTQVNRLIDERLKGRSFPEDGSGPVAVTVLATQVTPSGDRLLISLKVKAREQKSWFGLGAEAVVHVWGRPVLDRERQILRLAEVALDIRSEAAFGLLGAAARAAMPYLQAALADNAVIDLKPFMLTARRGIEAALADFRRTAPGVQVDAAVTGLRLADIVFDATTLRLTAEADGTARVAVTSLVP